MKRTRFAILAISSAAILVAAVAALRLAHTSSPPSSQPSVQAASQSRQPATPAAPAAVAAVPPTSPPENLHRAAPVWTVDKAGSRLSFRGVMNGEPFDGVFRDWDAQVAFDPKNLANSRATITVETASALTGQPIKDAALPNTEWLSTAAYPQATLVTRTLSQVGPNRYQAAALVRIRGIAWRTSVPFVVSINHDVGRMQATMTVDRRTFGIGEGPFRSPAPVEPSVQVSMRLLAKRAH